jgi:hypothetical protein
MAKQPTRLQIKTSIQHQNRKKYETKKLTKIDKMFFAAGYCTSNENVD